MDIFDSSIIGFLNKFAHHSWVFDNICAFLSSNNLVKGGIFIAIIWWLWFRNNDRQAINREHIISIILCCFIAVLFARALAILLPYRERPMHEAALNFVLPYGLDPSALLKWSSFPSDHAVLFFTLATGLTYISKKVGIFAFFYTIVFIAFPRIYLGVHYPTDIIAGALIGIAIGWLTNRSIINSKISKPIVNWAERKQSLFYPLFFLITYQITDLFDTSRDLLRFGLELLKHII